MRWGGGVPSQHVADDDTGMEASSEQRGTFGSGEKVHTKLRSPQEQRGEDGTTNKLASVYGF